MLKFRRRESLDDFFKLPQETPKKDKKKILRIAAIIIAAILVLAVIVGLFLIIGRPRAKESKIVAGAAKHLLLPAEKPAIVEIKNSADLIVEQPFYQGAKDGDYLLIYADAKKAVIYSLKRDIIVNAGPIFAGQEMEGLK